jgi:hypothetical protein
MALTQEEIEANKSTFLSLLQKIKEKRPSFRLDSLAEYLNSHRFFHAPASTKSYGAYEGGLCEHCLSVYSFGMSFLNNNRSLVDKLALSEDAETSIAIVCLLHDISKSNLYEEYVQNKKVYSSFGSKSDEIGKFDWVAQKAFKVRDASERFCYGSRGQESEYIVRCFMPINIEESCAILHHAGPFDSNVLNVESLGEVYRKHPLAAVLHMADFSAVYMNPYNE